MKSEFNSVVHSLVILSTFFASIDGQAIISMVDTSYVVYRPGHFTVNIAKTGRSQSAVGVIVQILNASISGHTVFVGSSQTVQFLPGSQDETKPMTFTVYDDGSPEPDRTYTLQMKVTSGDAVISQSNVAVVSVIGSNDPFGVFGFANPSPFVYEKRQGNGTVQLMIQRNKGSFGFVMVHYEVVRNQSATDPDFVVVPSAGTVYFQPGDTNQTIIFQILDLMSVYMETYVVRITNTTGGFSLDPSVNHPRLNTSCSELVLTIIQMIAAIRFSQMEYWVNVQSYYSTVTLTVYRGLSVDGMTQTGSTTNPATVYYYLVSDTARLGLDFNGDNSSVGFSAGITTAFISIQILPSSTRKTNSLFRVVLADPTGNVFLSSPSVATVIINANSDLYGVLSWSSSTNESYPLLKFGADRDSFVNLTVVRSLGTYGIISIQWSLTLNGSFPAGQTSSIGVSPTMGLIVFSDGEKEKVVTLSVVKDSSIQPVRVYRWSLLTSTVSGGARANGVLNAYVIDEDRGSAYGVVEFNASSSTTVLVDQSVQRKVLFTLSRSAGTYLDLVVGYTVAYLNKGARYTDVFLSNGSVVMKSGFHSATFQLEIKENVFVQLQSFFIANITDVHLAKSIEFGPYNSPVVGKSSSISVPVSPEVANGEIGFVDTTAQVDFSSNPNCSFLKVFVGRPGTFGNATVFWIISGYENLTTAVVISLNGSVDILSGQSQANFTVKVCPLNVTGLAERFFVQLVAAEPVGMQTLNSDSLLPVTVPETGNVAGIFQFSPDVQNSYIIQEEIDQISLSVIRIGSALVGASIKYVILPNGDAKFYGGTGVIYFQPSETAKILTIVARDDGVPQLNVTYVLHIESYGPRLVQIGERNSVILTVLPANQPYGLFSFPSSNYSTTVVLTKNQTSYPVNLVVQRLRGRFSFATVTWTVINPDDVISFDNLSGTLAFSPDQLQQTIQIQLTISDIPQLNKTIKIMLSGATGQAGLGPFLMASLIVKSYDYAIYFTEPVVRILAPKNLTVNITRDGPVDHVVTVMCKTVEGTAKSLDDFKPIKDFLLTFGIGVGQRSLNVTILDDGSPQPDQTFYIVLYNMQGDIVVTSNLTVIVGAHHNSNGVFHFGPPYSQNGSKGTITTFQVIRDLGIYGPAQIWYEILTMNGTNATKIQNGVHFQQNYGSIHFDDLQRQAGLSLNPIADNVPEFEQHYIIHLFNVTGGTASDPGLIGEKYQNANFSVAQSNNPFGSYSFQDGSQQVSIAEDRVPSDPLNKTIAQLIVSRTTGAADYHRDQKLLEIVSWEVYSYQIAGAHTLPPSWDLLLLANVPSSVTEANNKRRPGTGTKVLNFPGCDACYLSLSDPGQSQSDTSGSMMQTSFTVSTWLQSSSVPLSGCILTKLSPDGKTINFAMSLNTKPDQTTEINFMFQPNNQQISHLTVSLGQSLSDATWHLLLVQIYDGMMAVFVDGKTVGQSTMNVTLPSDPSQFLIGALSNGQNVFIGLLQDLRIYSQKLDNLQIQELLNMPSAKDVMPISGYLTFGSTDNSQILSILSIDNTISEPNKVFTVRLICNRGLSVILTQGDVSILTVLKSDNANGLFGFSGNSIMDVHNFGDSSITCPVQRKKGTYDSVVLSWQIFETLKNVTSDMLAVQNFINTTGQIMFEPGQLLSNITLSLINDGLPKITESFVVTITSVLSGDGLVGSTPTSGASIDPASTNLQLVIQPRNYPFGLFQFSTASSPPQANDSMTLPTLYEPQIRVSENIGVVRLLCVRAQGLLGSVSVEWKTLDGTAKSTGINQFDYASSAGQLKFVPGQRYALVNITIFPPNAIRDARQFKVFLVNPTNGAGVGIASVIDVVIEASVTAFGLFQFGDSSRNISLEKNSQIGQISNANFLVNRNAGTIGSVVLHWELQNSLEGDGSTDGIVSTAGTIQFAPGQASGLLSIQVLNDGTPSLDRYFFIILTNVSQGLLGDPDLINATLTILACNDPYGVYIISADSRTVYTNNVASNISVTVERKQGSGSYGTVLVYYSTLTPAEYYPYLPNNLTRADSRNFVYSSGSVVFPPHNVTAYFNITIKEDSRPQLDSVVFVRLVSVVLISGEQKRTVFNSPRLGSDVECFAEIVIYQHNFPHGILQLSNDSIQVLQNYTGPLVYIVRTGGLIGAVSIPVAAISGTAVVGTQVAISSDRVYFADGESIRPVPITIINNLIPQPELYFDIKILNQTTGGAVVGGQTVTHVTIQASLDVHGIFGFSGTDSTLLEPSADQAPSVFMTIVRNRGTLGVVLLTWTSNITDGSRVSSPASGSVYFLSSDTKQILTVNVQPRNINDPVKNVIIMLTGASNGGLLDLSRKVFTINMIPTSSPYGTIEFISSNYTVNENKPNAVQYIALNRINGTQGSARVYYNTQAADLIQEAMADGSTVFDYFNNPHVGRLLDMSSGVNINVKNEINPTMACASFCLSTRTCTAFVFGAMNYDCIWFTSTPMQTFDNRTEYKFYLKNSKAEDLYNTLAVPGINFNPELGAYITMENAAVQGRIPVYILSTNVPHLALKFVVQILKVELVSGDIGNPNFYPVLGQLVNTSVYIEASNYPHGVFVIYGNQGQAEVQNVVVQPKPDSSVQLTVERLAGSIGRVLVDWYIDPARSTAVNGIHYFANGATLTYLSGITQQNVAIGILYNNIPTDDMTVVIALRNPQNGARIGSQNNVTIIIAAHDHVAGVLAINRSTPYFVQEGNVVPVLVTRSSPAHGVVIVTWQIISAAQNQSSASLRFLSTSGSITLNEGVLESVITVNVAVRNEPAINNDYYLQLNNVTTLGVRSTGSAILDPNHSQITITIQGGNDPHGSFSFDSSSLSVKVAASNSTLDLVVIRSHGTIGTVRLHYSIGVNPSLSMSSDESTIPAIPDQSFVAVADGVVIVASGANVARITVMFLDDGSPKPNQILFVNLTRVELLQPAFSTFLPSLALTNTVAQVTILAQDGANGVVMFTQPYASLTVATIFNNLTIMVHRDKGTYGSVSIFCFAQSLGNAAVQGLDFIFQPTKLDFASGEKDKPILVQILESDQPRPQRQFQIILASPTNGLKIGYPSQAAVTILANDLAAGSVNFDSSDNITAKVATSGDLSVNSSFVLRILRGPGTSGAINVPYKVVDVIDVNRPVTRLTPSSGVITFNSQQSINNLKLSVVNGGSVPDHDELYTVSLLPPDGGALLGRINKRLIIVLRKGSPYGLFDVYFAGTRNNTKDVEAIDQVVGLQVMRTIGYSGQVSVDVVTQSETAVGQSGSEIHFSIIQQLTGVRSTKWFSYSANGDLYILLLNGLYTGFLSSTIGSNGSSTQNTSDTSLIFRWQGRLVPIQTVETDGARSATAFSIAGQNYLFIVNGGNSRNNYKTKSRLYQVQSNGILLVVQDLNTVGATDASHFSVHELDILLVTYYENIDGKTSTLSSTYMWNPDLRMFSDFPNQNLATVGAIAAETFSFGNDSFLIIANYFDSDSKTYELSSVVYRIDDTGSLIIHQKLSTKGAVDLTIFTTSPSSLYLVMANSRDDAGSPSQDVVAYVMNPASQMFEVFQNIPFANVLHVHSFKLDPNGPEYIILAGHNDTEIYRFASSNFVSVWKGEARDDFYPIEINQTAGWIVIFADVNANTSLGVTLWQLSLIGVGDFVPRAITIIFKDGQTSMNTTLATIANKYKQDTNQFKVQLVNPKGGAEIGNDWQLSINILPNINRFGVFQFAPESFSRSVYRIYDELSVVQFQVIRQEGSSGSFFVTWSAQADGQYISFLATTAGQLKFSDGQTSAFVNISILAGESPDSDVKITISLNNILSLDGSFDNSDATAAIGANATAVLLIKANETIYGSVSWEFANYSTVEPSKTAAMLTIYAVRGQGSIGQIRLTYQTVATPSLPDDQQALPWKDYVPMNSTVDMPNGVTRVAVQITILPNLDPELSESFGVNITSVQLLDLSTGNKGPRIQRPAGLTTITISEHGNARGVVEFGVIRNVEGRIDVHVGQSVNLKLVRNVKTYGVVMIGWLAIFFDDSTSIIYPSKGNVTFTDGQSEAYLSFQVSNVDILQLKIFEVKLMTATPFGAAVGVDRLVTIGILPSQSSSGVFSISPSTQTVQRSQTSNDPAGLVSFSIVRVGSDGFVNVQWRLDQSAINKLYIPHSGFIQFKPGEAVKPVSFQTIPDSILEGEEHVNLTIVTVDNGALISPTQNSAVIIITADTKAIGTISVSPNSLMVVIGRPRLGYDGGTSVTLLRTAGNHGVVQVYWQILVSDLTIFSTNRGIAVFRDLQTTTSIDLFVVDSIVFNLRQTCTLQLTSATAGALISPGAGQASIVFVAGNYPRGLFQFRQPASSVVNRKLQPTIQIDVIRYYGSWGQVRIFYQTSPGNASLADYQTTSGWLTFNEGQTRATISVTLLNSGQPEGPATFFLNLTSIQLLFPLTDNYTVLNGLQLDQPPIIGQASIQTITLVPTDDAAGYVQFGEESLSVVAYRDFGAVTLQITRGPGTYGSVSVQYMTSDITARLGDDYYPAEGRITIADGVDLATVNISLVNDGRVKPALRFSVSLINGTGGARLGSNILSVITIQRSGYPNGKFGFAGPLVVILPNPDVPNTLSLMIERSESLAGLQTIFWRIMGPNNTSRVLAETSDVAFVSNTNEETTSGSLVWKDNEGGLKALSLTIKSHTAWELQKEFVISIFNIVSSPSSVGSGDISPLSGNLTLIIQKYGYLNGLIGFDGVAQAARSFVVPQFGQSQLVFPISRSQGTVGNITISWKLSGPTGFEVSIGSVGGTLTMADGNAAGQIVLNLLSDSSPQFDRQFTLSLTDVEGGADIDQNFDTSTFIIKSHDNPYGRFLLQPSLQKIIVLPDSLSRQLQLNITRIKGLFGQVMVRFNISYDQAEIGKFYLSSTGSVLFNDGAANAIVNVDIAPASFLSFNSTFTVVLISSSLVGNNVSAPPDVVIGQNVAKVAVLQIAANSKIGFLSSAVPVDEISGTALVTINRIGSYGSVQVYWVAGFQSNSQQQLIAGNTNPSSGTVSMSHGQDTQQISLQVVQKSNSPGIFVASLSKPPISSALGGAQLLGSGFVTCYLEPDGIVQVSANSRNFSVNLSSGQTAQVSIDLERIFGSFSSLQIQYTIYSGNASGGMNSRLLQYGSVVMNSGQTTVTVSVQVCSFSVFKSVEYFYVNLTQVVRLSDNSSLQGVTPRLSTLHTSTTISVLGSGDPYGIFSIVLASGVGQITQAGPVNFTITRTGGSSGQVSVEVRSVGGGEPWDQQFGQTPGLTNETIGDVLINRDISKQAFYGQDYVQLDSVINFNDGDSLKNVTLIVLNSSQISVQKLLYVYILPLTAGVRVARPSSDNGLKGYAVLSVTLAQQWKEVIGFYPDNSSSVTTSEDSGLPARLTVERRNSSLLESFVVNWRALEGLVPRSPSLNLVELLTATSGSFQCLQGQRFCLFSVQLINDQKPMNETWFLVEISLDPSLSDVTLDPARQYCNVTVLKSDYPNGLLQFAATSRNVFVARGSSQAQLQVERLGFLQKVVILTYTTNQLFSTVNVAGLSIYPALEGADYYRAVGTLTFNNGVSVQTITVSIDPGKASDNPYPKMFTVQLVGVSGASEFGVQVANVTIVEPLDVTIWNLWAQLQLPLNNDTMLRLMTDLGNFVATNISSSQLILTEGILQTVIAWNRPKFFVQSVVDAVMNVFCELSQANRRDVTRGCWQLSDLIVQFAFTLVDPKTCGISVSSPPCTSVSFQVFRKYPKDINGFRWVDGNQDTFSIPTDLFSTSGQSSSTCSSLAIVDYNSEQWFTSSFTNQFLNNKVLTVVIENVASQFLANPVKFRLHTPATSIAPHIAECVYFNEDNHQWTSGPDICTVGNDLALGVDDFVDCSCKHMSVYAVRVSSVNPIYPIWFHISCFICMAGMAVSILTYYMCHSNFGFAINLQTHMCFAVLVTEICFVINAFLSPGQILNISTDDSNYRCIIMSVIMHYFFICQFTWLMSQGFNIYRTLLLNDEHTRRRFLKYFILGWGLPVCIVGLFYLVTYLVYRFASQLPVNKIYGDVTGNADICFITNAYAALAGILLPSVICYVTIVIVSIQTFQMSSQWKDYDDIYRGSRNKYEIKLLLIFWSLMAITWLWAGLHMAFRQLWLLILFVIFNIALGIYALLAYGVVRWFCFLVNKTDQKSANRPPVQTRMVDQPITVRQPNNSVPEDWINPKIDEQRINPRSDEQRINPRLDEQWINPRIDEQWINPRIDEQWINPKIEASSPVKTFKPLKTSVHQLPALIVRRSSNSSEYLVPQEERRRRDRANNFLDFDDLIFALQKGDKPKRQNNDRKIGKAASNKSFDTVSSGKRINIADTHI